MIKTLIWVNKKEDFERLNLNLLNGSFEIFISKFSDTKFKKVSKQMKTRECSKILKINENFEFNLFYKRNSAWTSTKFLDLVSIWMLKTGTKPNNKDNFIPEILKKGKKTSKINYPFKIDENNYQYYNDVIKFCIEENFVSKIWELNDDVLIFTFNEELNTIDENLFSEFSKKILSANQNGIKISSKEMLSENLLRLKTQYGDVLVEKIDNSKTRIFSLFSTDSNGESSAYTFTKGIITNIKNSILQNNEQPSIPKVGPKNIVIWTLSFLTVVVLLYVTFNFIFTPHNSKTALQIIFSGYTWSNIWVYLMSINFLISIFIGPLIAMFLFKLSNPKKKIKIKNYANFFISGQIRLAVVFITGNSILATIFWGWYMVKVIKIKTVSLVGMVASLSILRGILMVPIGGIFMIRGTLFNITILNEMGLNSEMAAFVSLSWIGWIWHIIHNLSISLLIFLPPLHIFYNKITIVRYGSETTVEKLSEKMTAFEMNLVQLKKSFRSVFKNKDRFYRAFTIIVANIFIETFEFTYSLRMVEDYAINVAGYEIAKANYWNVFAISGVRFMSGYVYHVPLLNAIPGQGLGLTDLVLQTSTIGIINHAHLNDPNIVNNNQIKELGQQSTFIIRFYNFYLRRLIALILSTIFIIKALFFRIPNK